MKVLFLCNKSPWPPREGGPLAMNMFIDGLIGAGHEVKVLSVDSWKFHVKPQDIPEKYRRDTGLELIPVDLRIKPLHALQHLMAGSSYHVSRFNSPLFLKRVMELLRDEPFDIVQLETVFMGVYLPAIRSVSKARVVLRAHNVEHMIWERIAIGCRNPLKKWYLRQLARTLKQFEISLCREMDGVIPITAHDARYLQEILTGKLNHETQKRDTVSVVPPICPIPFGVDPSHYDNPEIQTDWPSLFSIGSMNWIPNQEGIRWFLEKVWPDIHKSYPKLKYYLAGRAMPAWMVALNIPNVVVLGEVEDASRFMAEKAVMIVPLFSGSGIRIKIIEGMAAGKTIISTTLGAEGIDYTHRQNILIADSPCDFFEMISLAISDIRTSAAIGKAARELIRNHYDPRVLVGELLSFYRQTNG